jgi:NAD(P)-dependent dehydrogenase (short-subunit alcohol dehydrogenase family)
MELGESNVRVNSISPGGIATGIFGKAVGLPMDQAEKTAEVMKQALVNFQPIRRAGMVKVDSINLRSIRYDGHTGFIKIAITKL